MVKVEITIRQKEDGTYSTYTSVKGELPEAAMFEISRGVLNAKDVLNGER